MRYFFLFYLLNYMLHNPLLALLLIGAVFYFSEARYSGRYFNPASFWSGRSQIADLRRRLELNPHDVASHNDLGRLLAGQGKFAEGLPHMEEAIKRMDESPETNYFLGLCRLQSGASETGRASIEKALELGPNFLYGEPRLALARHHFDADRPEQAAAEAERCVSLNTSSVEAWLILGRARAELQRSAEARKAFASAVEAYDHLPHYLKLAARGFARQARKAVKSLG